MILDTQVWFPLLRMGMRIELRCGSMQTMSSLLLWVPTVGANCDTKP